MEGKWFGEARPDGRADGGLRAGLQVAQKQQPVPDVTLEDVLMELAREFPRSTIAVATVVWTALMVGGWATVLHFFRTLGVLSCLVIGPMMLVLTVMGPVFIAVLASSREDR